MYNAKFHLFEERLLSEADFVKIQFRTDGYARLSRKLGGYLSLRGGYAMPFEDTTEIPIENRFFLGGTGSLRGYPNSGVGTDATFSNGDPIGGSIMLNGSTELSHPLYKQVLGALFIDSGNVYDDESDFDPLNLRYSAGVGLRFETPIGPIKLDFGFIIDRRPDEPIGGLHFSIGVL